MPGDFDRLSFDSAKHYISVLLQEGRVSIPSDHNESVEILLRLLQNSNLDRVGCSGSPNYGFKIGELIPVDGMENLNGWSSSQGTDNNMIVTMEHFHMFEGKGSIRVVNNTGSEHRLTKTFDKVMDFSDSKNLYLAVSKKGDFLENFTIQLTDNMSNSISIQSTGIPRIGHEIPPNTRWDLYKFSIFESTLNVDFDMTSVKSATIIIPNNLEIYIDFLSRDYLHSIITWDSNTRNPFWNGSVNNPGSLDIDFEDRLFFGGPTLLCNDTSNNSITIQWDYDKPKNLMSGNNSCIISDILIPVFKQTDNDQALSISFVDEMSGEINLDKSEPEHIDFGEGANHWTIYIFSIPEGSLLTQVKSIRLKNIPSNCNIGPLRAIPNLGNDFIIVGDVGFDTSNTTCYCECNDQEMSKTVGKHYCNGKMCLKEHHGTYMTQDDYPSPTPISLSHHHDDEPDEGDEDENETDNSSNTENNKLLVILDCWEEIISYIQDNSIKEVALGGPDTAVRLKQMCAVRCIETDDHIKTLANCTVTGKGRLSTLIEESSDLVDPCSIEPISGYGGDNRLYRVEINKGGLLLDATFKWSKDNGSIETRIVGFDGKSISSLGTNITDNENNNNNENSAGNVGTTRISVESLGRDRNTMFKIGDYIEITDDSYEWSDYTNGLSDDTKLHQVGEIRQITDIDIDANTISWYLGLTEDEDEVDEEISSSKLHSELERVYRTSLNAKVRKWDGYGKVALDPNLKETNGNKFVNPQLRIGNGILLSFTDRDGSFRTRDFWTFKGREIPRYIDRLNDSLPMGPIHNFCPLALVDKAPTNEGIKEESVKDLRHNFPPSTDITGSDVYIDNTKCGMEGVQTVQQAIDRLCSERSGTLCSVTVREKTGEAIQQAISSLGEEGGVVCIPKGVYDVRTPIKISSGITLKGEGIATRIISGNDNLIPTPEIFSINSSSFVNLRDLFIGFANNQTAISIRSVNRNSDVPSNISIEDCIFFQKGLDNENEIEIDNELENRISAIQITGSALGLEIKNNLMVCNKALSLSNLIDGSEEAPDISGLEFSHNTVFCRSIGLLCSTQGSLSTWKINNNWISGMGSVTTDAIDLAHLSEFISLAKSLMSLTTSKYFFGEEKPTQITCKGVGILIRAGLAEHFEIQNNTVFSNLSCIATTSSSVNNDNTNMSVYTDIYINRNFMYSSGENSNVIDIQGKMKNSSISYNHVVSSSIFKDVSNRGGCIRFGNVVIEDISIVNNVFGGNFGIQTGYSQSVIGFLRIFCNSFFCKSSAITRGKLAISHKMDISKNIILGCLLEEAIILRGQDSSGVSIIYNWMMTFSSGIVIAGFASDSAKTLVDGNFINVIKLSSRTGVYGVEVSRNGVSVENNSITTVDVEEINIPVPDFDGDVPWQNGEINAGGDELSVVGKNMVGGILVGEKKPARLLSTLSPTTSRQLENIILMGTINRKITLIGSPGQPAKFAEQIIGGIYSLRLVLADGSNIDTDEFIVEPGAVIELMLFLNDVENERLMTFMAIPSESMNSTPFDNITIQDNFIKDGSGNGISIVSNTKSLMISGNSIINQRLAAVSVSAMNLATDYLSIVNNQIVNCCKHDAGRILYADLSRWNSSLALAEGKSMMIYNNRIIIKSSSLNQLRSKNIKFFIKNGIMIIDPSFCSINNNHIFYENSEDVGGNDDDDDSERPIGEINKASLRVEVGIELLDAAGLQIQNNTIETNGIALLKSPEISTIRTKNRELALAMFEKQIANMNENLSNTTISRTYSCDVLENNLTYVLRDNRLRTRSNVVKVFPPLPSNIVTDGLDISINGNIFSNNLRTPYPAISFVILRGLDKVIFNDNIITDMRVLKPFENIAFVYIAGKKTITNDNQISTNENQSLKLRSDFVFCTGNILSNNVGYEEPLPIKKVENNIATS